MSLWDDMIGHSQVKDWFERAVERHRLSHSYIFSGPAGIGKRLFARKIAQSLLCETSRQAPLDACGACPNCARFRAGSHPDYYELRCPEGKREIPVELFVGDLEHRGREGLCYELSLRPMAGDRKVAIIDDAHLMNRESGNSLLKTLEEPPENSLIVLISSQEDALLPTIRSRCQLVRFPPLSEQELRVVLRAQIEMSDEKSVVDAIRMSNGNLEVARSLLDGIPAKLIEVLQQALSQSKIYPLELNAKLMEKLEECSDALTQREACLGVLRYLGEMFRNVGRSAANSADQGERLHLLLPRLREAERQLHEAMPISLWMQGFIGDLARIYAV